MIEISPLGLMAVCFISNLFTATILYISFKLYGK